MASTLLARILRETENADLLDALTERLSLTDLQSLLLHVYERRAAQQSPARLLEQYESNRFVCPSPTAPRTLLEFDARAFSLASDAGFQPVELSPVCPLGTVSTVSSVSQNNTVTTIRNTEVVSDSTNVLALESAVRRRTLLASSNQHEWVRLCASHRVLRAQPFHGPASFAHFRLFALTTAGRDEGSYRFERETLAEHVGFYLTLMTALRENGSAIGTMRVALTDFYAETRGERILTEVRDTIAARFPTVLITFASERTTGRGYYDGICFHLYATDNDGDEHFLADGGMTNWTQQLLSNRKERFFISGIGTERVCAVFAAEQGATDATGV
jgi:hypothetical protein